MAYAVSIYFLSFAAVVTNFYELITGEIIQLHPSTKRIEFIDALRGFTIFLVVLQHVEYMCLNVNNSVASLNSFFIQ